MISPKLMMFFAFILIMGTIVGIGSEGVYTSGDEVEDLSESLTGFSVNELSGLGGVVVGASGFFAHGLPKMLLWDYPMFESDIASLHWFLQIIRVICIIVVSAGLVFGLVTQFQSYMIPAMIGSGIIWGIGSLLS